MRFIILQVVVVKIIGQNQILVCLKDVKMNILILDLKKDIMLVIK